MPVVFPVHPRTRQMLEGAADLTAGSSWSTRLGYLDFLSLEADAAAVLTDSGGIQEETTFLGAACFTLRDNTERPITLRAGHQPPARPGAGADADGSRSCGEARSVAPRPA